MYYEEKVEDDTLYYRNTPNGEWTIVPYEEVLKRMMNAEAEVQRLTLGIKNIVRTHKEKK
jgi:hypothetical protein